MKKIITFCLLVLWMSAAWAQPAIYAPRFIDGWSLSVAGGVTHPLVYSFTRRLARPVGELSLHKQLTPSLGLALEGFYAQGDSANRNTYYSRMQLGAMGTLNLARWLGGYYGQPRWVELVGKVGASWGRTFDPTQSQKDFLAAKVGVELNVFLSSDRAWSIGLRPALVYNLRSSKAFEQLVFTKSQADLQMLFALTYHFRNSRGGHHLAAVPIVLPVQKTRQKGAIDDLQATTTQMRQDLSTKEQLIAEQQQRIAELEQLLPAKKFQQQADTLPPPNIGEASVVVRPEQGGRIARRQLLEERISFAPNSVVVDTTQFAAIERLAQCLEKYPNAHIVVQGFASPEGSPEFNTRVSQARAEVVRALLIAQYGIRRERIRVIGGGTSKERVSVCTIVKE